MKKRPALGVSLIPVSVLITLLSLNVFLFKDGATSGPNQMALLISAFVAGVLGYFLYKTSYDDIEKRMIESIQLSMQAILILLIVGSLIALWIISGIVPSMVKMGLALMDPSFFLPLCCVICSIVSIATGSSWSTAGTLGVALMGVGKTLGIPDAYTAGAIVSGSYFGDKMSPLSDTTNLAPAMAGTDLFTHVRYMIYTTVPALILAILMFVGLSFTLDTTAVTQDSIAVITQTIDQHFVTSPFLLLIPALVIFMVAKKVPAIPALIIGAVLGAVAAALFQSDLIQALSGKELSLASRYEFLLTQAYGGVKLNSGNTVIDQLFSQGGMNSMLDTVWLILSAMVFGGVMDGTGMLDRLANSILTLVHGTKSLIFATLSSCILLNITASDQYLSIVVAGKMFKKAFKQYGLAPQNLSRALEDAGTVTSVLVPWNTCGAYFSTVLGVSTLHYLPFSFFNLLCPIISLLVISVNWKVVLVPKESEESFA